MKTNSPASAPMPLPNLPSLTLIVATTPSLGIGLRGTLPWPPLKSDLAFFARVTKRAPPSGASNQMKNAVIMGRKTWESIPQRFRPLKDRINVVVTRSPEAFNSKFGTQSGLVLATGSIEAGLRALQEKWPLHESEEGGAVKNDSEQSEQRKILGRVFVIGGAEVYKLALKMDACERVLWTRLGTEWECDTFFPNGVLEPEDHKSGVKAERAMSGKWMRRSRQEIEAWAGEDGVEGPKKEGDVEFEVLMIEKEKASAHADA